MKLCVPGRPDEALLTPATAAFWTDHSERGGLDGWHTAMKTEHSQRSFLGRWAAASSTDAYVRIAVRVVENLQIEAALAASTLLSGGQDVFGEEHVLHDMRRFAQARGEGNEAIDRVVRNLTRANLALYPGEADYGVDSPPGSPAPSHWAGQSHASEPAGPTGEETPGSVTECGDSDGDADDEKVDDDNNDEKNTAVSAPGWALDGSMLSQLLSSEILIVPSGQVLHEPLAASGLAAPAAGPTDLATGLVGDSDSGDSSPGEEAVTSAVRAQLEADPPPQGFVVANTLAGVRRLHYMGHCGKVPGLHYHRYTVFGQTVPDPTVDYDKRCLNCFESDCVTLSPKQNLSSEDSSSSDGDSVVAMPTKGN